MKWPWQRLEIKVANTFKDMREFVVKHNEQADKALKEKMMGQINIVKQSEQFKHNDIQTRLQHLENCFKIPLDRYHAGLVKQEADAARDAEKNMES